MKELPPVASKVTECVELIREHNFEPKLEECIPVDRENIQTQYNHLLYTSKT